MTSFGQKQKTRLVPWITVFLAIAVLRGFFFPDFRNDFSLLVIPFLTPVICAVLAVTASFKNTIRLWISLLFGFLCIILSDVIGTIVYGTQCGWHYVTDDVETQAVLLFEVVVQLITYLACYGIIILVRKLGRKQPKVRQ
jgi:hypothetical protein